VTTEAHPTICQHQSEVQLLVQFSLARSHRASIASTMSSKMLVDEKMAACQAECGDTSPYRDVELHPIPREEAVALVQRSNAGYIDIILEEFADMGRSLRAGLRRMRRPAAASDTEVTHAQ
jgi:hypothetical protein